jgi:hypothetical protein
MNEVSAWSGRGRSSQQPVHEVHVQLLEFVEGSLRRPDCINNDVRSHVAQHTAEPPIIVPQKVTSKSQLLACIHTTRVSNDFNPRIGVADGGDMPA